MEKIKSVVVKALSVTALAFTLNGCLDEMHPGTYYTFEDHTISSFLEDNGVYDFSLFIEILKKAHLWGEMATYGEYTCFAPTNEAIEQYLREKGYASVADIPDIVCDTIGQTHLLNNPYFTTDLVEGAFPSPNRLDRYLSFSCDSGPGGTPRYYVNKDSWLMRMNDTVQNGVVHVVDRVIEPSTLMLPELIAGDSTVSLFYKALILTHMNDSLEKYMDLKYHAPGGDSCTIGVYYHTGNEWEYAIFPEKRYFKYTAFVEPDSVYNKHGIYTLEDLIQFANDVYHESYPADGSQYDDDFTDRRNPLNRFVSYHLLEFYGQYDAWNVTNRTIVPNYQNRGDWDIEDFFECMLPHSFMRFCTPQRANPNGIYINRKGSPNNPPTDDLTRGVRIYSPSEMPGIQQDALNGIYHYVDEILVYSRDVRNVVLNTRIRYDCTTMSPDFVNSGGRNRYGGPSENQCTGMINGFTKWWSFSPETLLSIRSRHQYFASFQGDEVILQGIYDATVKLPPVPFDGTYEVRVGYPPMNSRGIIQAYFGTSPDYMDPTDIPTDLRVGGSDPKIGWFEDGDYSQEEIRLLEKGMRNRGYMKGPACYSWSGTNMRTATGTLRKIITTQYMSAEGDYYLRVRQLMDNNMAEMVYDYLELVPKTVWGSEEGENIY